MEARRLTKMALLTALLCVSAWISFPLPFSPAMVTALTLVATLTGLLLSPKDTLIVFIVYVLLGTVGLPVFVGGTSGLGKLLGPTGGFIFSWPVAYTLLSICKGKSRSFLSYSWRSILITIGRDAQNGVPVTIINPATPKIYTTGIVITIERQL